MNALIDKPVSDVVLTHPFKDMIPNVDEFFLSVGSAGVVNTVNAFCDRVKSLADRYALTIDPDKFKGYALELFAEYLCKSNASDNRIGMADNFIAYLVTKPEKDELPTHWFVGISKYNLASAR